MYILSVKIILRLFFIYIFIVNNVNSFLFTENQSEIIPNEGLYNSNDYVVVLNISNLKNTIYDSKIAWVVEFYSSWCGHCQRFAPIWKALAHDMRAWHDIVDVAAIDCANDDNNPLCREYEIMFYPMIRYFSPQSKHGSLGVRLEQGGNEESMKNQIIKQLEINQQDGMGLTWPNITPYRSSKLEDLWNGVPESVVYRFIFFEQTDSSLGSEVILDFHNTSEILIRRVTSDNQILCIYYQVTDFPHLLAFDRNGVRTTVKIVTPTRLGIMQVIEKFIKSKGLNINIPNVDLIDAQNINGNDKGDQSQNSPVSTVDIPVDQTDLETTIRYSLEHEIPLQKIISESMLTALKEYLSILAQYFPLKNGKSTFFDELRVALDGNDSITGENFYKLVKTTENEMSPVYSTNKEWIQCKGSNQRLRGYPCGLWTLFHTLTVNYAASNTEIIPHKFSIRILSTMYNYIKHFFGCVDCSEHFVTMAEKFKLFSVKSANESVLWLWQAHNQVNERLAGDITEDPKFPKIQYPSSLHCPQCRSNENEWNLTEVLKYLKNKYTHVSNEGQNISYSQYSKLVKNDLSMNKNITMQQKTGWDFTLFDISICVVLYVTSALILILVCIKFLVKRSSKKKMQIHSLFLRV